MLDLTERVQRAIEEHRLLAPDQAVVVGVSGGPDSLCLLHVLCRLAPTYPFSLHVGHLNHGIRGREADEDADFVARLAVEWGLGATIEWADVPALAHCNKMAIEEAARCARYVFLSRLARRIGAPAVAVAHNADDQTETVLMHWLRGSGLSGLRGMLPAAPLADYRLIEDWHSARDENDMPADVPRGREDGQPITLIRPLLTISRTEIESYCRHHNLHPRIDRSNLDTTYFRNRLRHELIPCLEKYNVNIRQVLRRTAEVITADYELLRGQLQAAWGQVVRSESADAVVFDLVAWRQLPLGLQRSTLREAIHHLRRALRNIDFVHVEDALEVATGGETGTHATLPQGITLTVGYDTLVVAEEAYSALPDLPLLTGGDSLPVAVPGNTHLPGTAWVLRAGLAQVGAAATTDAWQASLDAEFLGRSPRLRRRRTGDRFCPFGLGGRSKRVNEFMINAKIPVAWREYIPLLVNDADQIVWVCGWRPDERARVTPATRAMVHVRFERENV
jgi:tRNA(Ile)-lysidine synthase